jgi:hypothetical protein
MCHFYVPGRREHLASTATFASGRASCGSGICYAESATSGRGAAGNLCPTLGRDGCANGRDYREPHPWRVIEPTHSVQLSDGPRASGRARLLASAAHPRSNVSTDSGKRGIVMSTETCKALSDAYDRRMAEKRAANGASGQDETGSGNRARLS